MTVYRYFKTSGRAGVPLLGCGDVLKESSEWGDYPAIEGELQADKTGYHVCRTADDALVWAGPEMWLVEVRGGYVNTNMGAAFREQRPIARVMGERTWREFAIERALEELLILAPTLSPFPALESKLINVVNVARQYNNSIVGDASLSDARRAGVEARKDMQTLAKAAGKPIPADIQATLDLVVHAVSTDPWAFMGWPINEKIYEDPALVMFANRHVDMFVRMIEALAEGVS